MSSDGMVPSGASPIRTAKIIQSLSPPFLHPTSPVRDVMFLDPIQLEIEEPQRGDMFRSFIHLESNRTHICCSAELGAYPWNRVLGF
jgi:hypothetical protein